MEKRDYIKKLRVFLKLSQKQLADKLGIQEETIKGIESGQIVPTNEEISKIADVLGVSELAIMDPTIRDDYGIMHTLFKLEDCTGLDIREHNGRITLQFEEDALYNEKLMPMLYAWSQAKKELESSNEGDIKDIARKRHNYDMWRYSFPRYYTEAKSEEMYNKEELYLSIYVYAKTDYGAKKICLACFENFQHEIMQLNYHKMEPYWKIDTMYEIKIGVTFKEEFMKNKFQSFLNNIADEWTTFGDPVDEILASETLNEGKYIMDGIGMICISFEN